MKFIRYAVETIFIGRFRADADALLVQKGNQQASEARKTHEHLRDFLLTSVEPQMSWKRWALLML